MKRKLSILYAWLVRTLTFFLPDISLFMRLRGGLYSFVMKSAGTNFQVAHSAILNSISELSVGNNVYIANGSSLLCGGGIIVSDNVLFGPGVVISSNNHTFEDETGYRFGKAVFGGVIIGRGSWICANSVITKGACFPEFSILGPCSVYNQKQQGNNSSLYSGIPAKLIGPITS